MNVAPRRFLLSFAGVTMALLLSACSSMRIVDSDVTAFTGTAGAVPAAGARYRFERLPSQQAAAGAQQSLEEVGTQALARAGLQRDDAGAQYSVQLSYRVIRDPQAPWDDPRYIQGYVRPFPVVGRYGVIMRNPSLSMAFDYPYYRRELVVLVRRLSDGAVVYETHAQHDGRWSDDEAVLPAMFTAALQGYPHPPAGPKRVDVEIPR